MLTDKELKKKFVLEFAKTPAKYYPNAMAETGFSRKKCASCFRAFWSVLPRNVCGDSSCCNGYSFIGATPAKNVMSYPDVWRRFSALLKKQGYAPINRYPVSARWRNDLHFVEASIDDFIPYVVSGEVKPPANPLVVPQPCLRFNDIENVGITGAHYTCFVMIGQHRFEKPADYKAGDYFLHLLKWFTEGMGIPLEEIVLHEDVWAGSGNFGPCIEFFSRGLELANQVYMQYRQTESGYEDLPLKVLDMGMGQERNAWFSRGAPTSYETTFPTVLDYLKKKAGVKTDEKAVKEFLPYASLLNVDEVQDVAKAWNTVAKKTSYDVAALKERILPLAALYSIAEHTRALLFALNDGTLPSNVGGGYNLRLILRRAFSLARKHEWEVDFAKIMEIHASFLESMYPELKSSLKAVPEIIAYEQEKYDATGKKSREIIAKLKSVDTEKLIELYDSHGITPETVKKEKPDVRIPENFYPMVAERHRHAAKKETKMLDVNAPATEMLYYKDGSARTFTAKSLVIKDGWVVLDRTLFYPEGGGQQNDTGTINGARVTDVQKFAGVIGHKIESVPFKAGSTVKGTVDDDRRNRLMAHHSAIHIVNGVARKILGSHVWQAGTLKTPDKAHIDLTHYKALTDEELDAIEREANEAVEKHVHVSKRVIERTDAEKKYGMTIYQGPAVPAKELRIIDMDGVDVEACGGTHVDNTADVGKIIITGTEKIQDGIVRLTLVAGKAAEEYHAKMSALLKETEKILGTTDVVGGAERLFSEWKNMKKEREKSAMAGAEALRGTRVAVLPLSRAELLVVTKAGGTYILFGSKDHSIVVTSESGSAEKLFAEAVKLCGGRGGGEGAIAQGVYEKEPDESMIKRMRKIVDG